MKPGHEIGLDRNGQPYAAVRGPIRLHRAFSVSEAPPGHACVPGTRVAGQMALRNFDRPPFPSGIWLRGDAAGQRKSGRTAGSVRAE